MKNTNKITEEEFMQGETTRVEMPKTNTKDVCIKEFETWMLMNTPSINEILAFAESVFDEGYKSQWLPNYEKAFKEEIGKEFFKEGYEMGSKVYKDVCAEERNKTVLEILNKLEEYLPDAWYSEQTGVEKTIRLIKKLDNHA